MNEVPHWLSHSCRWLLCRRFDTDFVDEIEGDICELWQARVTEGRPLHRHYQLPCPPGGGLTYDEMTA